MNRPPKVVCQEIYESMKTSVTTRGLDETDLDRSAAVLSQPQEKGAICLKKSAYYPTGLAIGCPIAQKRIEDLLWKSALKVHRETLKVTPPEAERGGLAFVPKSSYHTTIVNRTHYRKSGSIRCLSPAELKAAESVLKSKHRFPIIVDYRGMILAPSGALLVPGYPKDDRLYQIRQDLADHVQGFKGMAPQTAHIKLGHLLNRLSGRTLSELLVFIYRQGEKLDFSLQFFEVFTPLGIIAPSMPKKI